MSKLEKNHKDNDDNKDSQTGIRCCDNLPSFTIKYDVAGVFVVYSVCESCSKLDCFSQFVVEKVPVQNENEKIKNNSEHTERNEIIDDIIENVSENNEHATVTTECTEQTTCAAFVSNRGED